VRILKHSHSQYTEGDSFCKYYNLAFAIHTRLAGDLSLELILVGRKADIKIVLKFAIPASITAVIGALLLNYFANVQPVTEYISINFFYSE